MTFKQLLTQCDDLNALTGRKFKVESTRADGVCLSDESGRLCVPWVRQNTPVSQWMDGVRLGYEIAKAKYRRLDGNVECCMCGRQVPEETAHLHQDKWIGDNCCWDERLRSSE